MKKTFITLSVIMLTAMSAFAQGGQPESNRYIASKWGQNWFIGARGGINYWAGKGGVQGNMPNYGGGLYLGHWVNHYVGLRLNYDLHQNQNVDGKFFYHNLFGNVMFSPIDMFRGSYDENRIYTPIIYAGAGGVMNSGSKMFANPLHGNINREMVGVAGLMNVFKLGRIVDLHIDFQIATQRWSIDQKYFSKPLLHNEYSAEIGLTFNLGGRSYDRPYDCDEALRQNEEMIRQLRKENEELRNRPAVVEHKPCDTVVKFVNVEGDGQLISTPFSIFFNKGSYEITSKRDIVNLGEMVKSAKAGDYKIRLRGTCDSSTGSKEINQRLAENRCRRVKEELVKLGMPENRIVVDAAGGVSELAPPAELDRRVFVELIK